MYLSGSVTASVSPAPPIPGFSVVHLWHNAVCSHRQTLISFDSMFCWRSAKLCPWTTIIFDLHFTHFYHSPDTPCRTTAIPCTLSRGFSLRWTRLIGWRFHRPGLTTSPRSSVGWRRKSGLISSWLSSCTNVCMGQLRHTLPTIFASRRISKPDDVCALLCRRHSSSAALVGQPLAIEQSRSPAPMFGTVCNNTLRLHPHCLSSAAASKLTSFGAVSLTFSSPVVPAQWQCNFGHYNRLLYCIIVIRWWHATLCRYIAY